MGIHRVIVALFLFTSASVTTSPIFSSEKIKVAFVHRYGGNLQKAKAFNEQVAKRYSFYHSEFDAKVLQIEEKIIEGKRKDRYYRPSPAETGFDYIVYGQVTNDFYRSKVVDRYGDEVGATRIILAGYFEALESILGGRVKPANRTLSPEQQQGFNTYLSRKYPAKAGGKYTGPGYLDPKYGTSAAADETGEPYIPGSESHLVTLTQKTLLFASIGAAIPFVIAGFLALESNTCCDIEDIVPFSIGGAATFGFLGFVFYATPPGSPVETVHRQPGTLGARSGTFYSTTTEATARLALRYRF